MIWKTPTVSGWIYLTYIYDIWTDEDLKEVFFIRVRQPVSGRGCRRMRAIMCEGKTWETRGENNRAMMSWGEVLTRKRDGQTETVYSHRSGLITFYCLAHKSVTSDIRHGGHCNITCWGNTPPTGTRPEHLLVSSDSCLIFITSASPLLSGTFNLSQLGLFLSPHHLPFYTSPLKEHCSKVRLLGWCFRHNTPPS